MVKFIKGLIKPAADAYSARQQRKAAEHAKKIDLDIARLQANAAAVREGRAHDADWELASIRNSGWKDELWAIWFAVTATAAFFWPERLIDGLVVIDSLPSWYTGTFVAVVLASYGIRVFRLR